MYTCEMPKPDDFNSMCRLAYDTYTFRTTIPSAGRPHALTFDTEDTCPLFKSTSVVAWSLSVAEVHVRDLKSRNQ
jgi:hypothetical protein